jgi:hypothetical protein
VGKFLTLLPSITFFCRRHDVGSIGIENAEPALVQQSLLSASPSFPQRQEFSQQELLDAGFLNAFNMKQVRPQHVLVIQPNKLPRALLIALCAFHPLTAGVWCKIETAALVQNVGH